MTLDVEPPKPDRLHADEHDEAVVRHLMQISGKSKEAVIEALNKVGGNLESARRELGCPDVNSAKC
jgi:hypothetical protein